MNVTYYVAGFISGISITGFFIGKELYRYYIKDKVQKKQLYRLSKLNDKMKAKKSAQYESSEFSNSL
ncbi:hypothetical protein [Flavobacterium hibernum]|uniref:Uncharacterized protein n=1 Tax=Flavobacterium hibernum TaxID=37752 RepID=A0A0D0F9B0_9FLAO|nr:hypothetical protein [Flavobacterium hibernum]KIO54577.1 hypothetical protein IW18_00770 [Flavobacterium hibernum]OXA84643.1 hypothetical protein B0A73_18670 [Flavobacterium hibernum]STO10337.1 Uncharacterised protein [Flavobacterium hibernum]